MTTAFLVRGMLIGVFAGLLVFGFSWVFGEPEVDKAIAYEEQMAKTKEEGGHHGNAAEAEEPELVSRPVQSTLGLLTAVVVFGTAVGGLFALANAVAYGRINLRPRLTALLLAGTGFLVFYLVPSLKYPANPPAVGLDETIGLRTATYFLMILLSIVTLAFSTWLRQRILARFGGWNATLIAAAAFIVIIAAAMLILPTINEVPDGFSAMLLWRFRLTSLGMHVILWTTLGLVFGALTERSLAQS